MHDPNSEGGRFGEAATLGALAGLAGGPSFAMADGGPYDGNKAYADSKLANILFARELARRLQQAGGDGGGGTTAAAATTTVVAVGPGLITKTGFFRRNDPLFVAAFDAAAGALGLSESVSGGGDCLVFAATSPGLTAGGGGGIENGSFLNNNVRGPWGGHRLEARAPSPEARDGEEGRRLWELSARLVGLGPGGAGA